MKIKIFDIKPETEYKNIQLPLIATVSKVVINYKEYFVIEIDGHFYNIDDFLYETLNEPIHYLKLLNEYCCNMIESYSGSDLNTKIEELIK